MCWKAGKSVAIVATFCIIALESQIALLAAASEETTGPKVIITFDLSTRKADELWDVKLRPKQSLAVSCPNATTNPPNALDAERGEYCLNSNILGGSECSDKAEFASNPYVKVSDATGTSATFSTIGKEPGLATMYFSCTRNDGPTALLKITILTEAPDAAEKNPEIKALK